MKCLLLVVNILLVYIVMSLVPSERITCDIRFPAAREMLPTLDALLNSGTLLNWMMKRRCGAVPRVSKRIEPGATPGSQSDHARAMMFFGLRLDGSDIASE